VLRGQIDISARVIWIFERFGLGARRPLADPAAPRQALHPLTFPFSRSWDTAAVTGAAVSLPC
jgi:hypothetical protein